MFRRVDSGTTPQFELPIQHPPTHPTWSASSRQTPKVTSTWTLPLHTLSLHTSPLRQQIKNYRQRPQLENQEGGTVTSGEWLLLLLRLFSKARPSRNFKVIPGVQSAECRLDACHRVRAVSTVQPSAWFGWASSRLSQSRSVALQELQVQGSTSTSASRSRSRSVRNTLLPTPGTVQVCGQLCNCNCTCTSPAPGRLHSHSLLPVDLKNKVCPLRLHYTAHKHTSVQSRPVCHRPSFPPHHHLRQS